MALKQAAPHKYLSAFANTNLELWESDGVPTESGPKKGALVVDTTNGKIYINTGTTASATWNAVGDIAAGEITLATGSVLVGTAGVAAAVDAKTSGQILVGNGTTVASVAVSGDGALASNGVITVTGATGAFNIGTNQTFTKEVNHTIAVATTTTANAAGATLGVAAGAGQGTGAGGVYTSAGGASGTGATGNGGIGRIMGGAALSTDGVGGKGQVIGGAGSGTGAGGHAEVTGGAGGGGGNGGDVVLTPGAGGGPGVSGKIMNRGMASVKQGTTIAKSTSTTLTANEVLSGIITVNQAGAATSALQLPTASDLDTALSNFANDDAFDFSVINTSTVDAEDASITTNTGLTLVGNMDIHAYSAAGSLNSSGRFRARKTGAAAWTVYRIS